MPLPGSQARRATRSWMTALAALALLGGLAMPLVADPGPWEPDAAGKMAPRSHNRYNALTWEATTGLTIDFTLTNAWRWSSYNTCYTAALANVACTGTGGRAAPGDIIRESTGGTSFCFGDGQCTGTLFYLVTSVDEDRNALYGLALEPGSGTDTKLTHTYATAGTYTAAIETCCRISGFSHPNAHMNNPNGYYRAELRVDVGSGNDAPTSSMPAIKQCIAGEVCTFTIPVIDPDGDTVRCRLATSAEAAGAFGSFTQPAGALVSDACVYTVDTAGLASYNAGAEGPRSSDTCYDGLDNDGDGLVDGRATASTDYNQALRSLGGALAFHDKDRDVAWDMGEHVFTDADASGTISAGDLRWMKNGTLAPGSMVLAGQRDLGVPLVALAGTFRAVDVDASGGFTFGDLVVLDANNDGLLTRGEPRVSRSGAQALGTPVPANDPNLGAALVAAPETLAYRDADSDTLPGASEARYLGSSGTAVANLAVRVGSPPSPQVLGSQVRGFDPHCDINVLYSTQVLVEDLDGAGNVKSHVPVDFFLSLDRKVGAAPYFTQPLVPACGSTVTATAGKELRFDVLAKDDDKGDTVTLSAGSLPQGAHFDTVVGSPASTHFEWTVPADQRTQVVLSFVATDVAGNQGSCTITVDAVLPVAVGLTNIGFEGTGAGCSLAGWNLGTVVDSAAAVATDATPDPDAVPREGSCMARLGTSVASAASTQPIGTNEIWQEFLASNSAKLVFQTNVFSHDFTGFDRAGWEIKTATGDVVASHWQDAWGPNADTALKTTGWETWTPDLAAYHGQKLRLRFAVVGASDDANPTWMYVDAAATPSTPPPAWIKVGPPVQDPRVASPSYTHGPYSYRANADGTMTVALSNPGQAASPTSLQFGAYVTCPDGSAPTSAGDPYAGAGSSGVDLLLNDKLVDMSMGTPLPADLPTWYTTRAPTGGADLGIPAADVAAGQLSLRVDCNGVAHIVRVGAVVPYDPTGTVRDGAACATPGVASTCTPVQDAEVTLHQVPGWIADSATEERDCESAQSPGHVAGQWTQPAPATLGERVNPLGGISPAAHTLRTTDLGHFGWDLPAGCWFVVVKAAGYESLVGPVLGAPPAADGLELLLTPVGAAAAIQDAIVELTVGPTFMGIVPVQFRDAATGASKGHCEIHVQRKAIGCLGGAIAMGWPHVLVAAGRTDVVVPAGPWISQTQTVPLDAGKVRKVTLQPGTDQAVLEFRAATPGVNGFEAKVYDAGTLNERTTCTGTLSTETLTCTHGVVSPAYPFALLPTAGKVDVVVTAVGAAAGFFRDVKTNVKLDVNKVAVVPMSHQPDPAGGGLLEISASQPGVGDFALAFDDGSTCSFLQATEVARCTGGKAVSLGWTGRGAAIVGFPGGATTITAEADGPFEKVTKPVKVLAGKSVKLLLQFPATTGTGMLRLDVLDATLRLFTVDVVDQATGSSIGSCVVAITLWSPHTGCSTSGQVTSPRHLYLEAPPGTYALKISSASPTIDQTLTGQRVVSGKTTPVKLDTRGASSEVKLKLEVKPSFMGPFELSADTASGTASCRVDPVAATMTCDAGGLISSPAWPMVVLRDPTKITADAGPRFSKPSLTLSPAGGNPASFAATFAFA